MHLRISSKLRIILLFMIVPVFPGIAQSYECRNYDLPARNSVSVISAEQRKHPMIVISEKRFLEYIYDANDNLELYFTCHRLIHINEQKALEENNRLYIPVNHSNDLVTFKARTIGVSGKITEMFKGDMQSVTEDGRLYMILAVEGLETGGELEFFYTIKRDLRFFGTEYFQGNSFIAAIDFELISPGNLIIESKGYNSVPDMEDSTNGKNFRFVHLDSIHVLPEEKYSNPNANRKRIEYKLAWNKVKPDVRLFTWVDAGRRYYEIMHETEKDDRKTVSRLINDLHLKDKNANEQITNLENYFKTEISIVESPGEESMASMLKKKFGSENTVVMTYVQVLEQLNIPYELVITSDRFNTPFDEKFDSWAFLDKYLLYFPGTQKFLDPTGYLHRYGMIPFENTNMKGLFIRKVTIGESSNGVSMIKSISCPDMHVNFDNLQADIVIAKNLESAKIVLHREMNGYLDNGIRASYFYSSEEKKKEIANELVTSWYEDMKPDNIIMSNYNMGTNEIAQPFLVSAEIDVTGLIEKAGVNYLFNIGEVIGKQVEMYQDHNRFQPIEIAFPHKYKRKIIMKIPDGFEISGLEKLNFNYVYKNKEKEGMGFTSQYKMDGKLLSIEIEEYYSDIYLPVTEFENFKKVVNAAADFNKVKLILTPQL